MWGGVMPTAKARRHRLLIFVAVVAAAVAAAWLANRNAIGRERAFARKLCLNVASSRVQGNKRATVIRTFLLVAARTRAASAEIERRAAPKEAVNDLKAARLYRDLAAQVHELPAPAC